MEGRTSREIQALLAMPFAPEDIEWRLQTTIEEKQCGIAIPYVTNRAIQNRLDEVVGLENWYNEFKPWHSAGKKEAQICGIAIYFEGRGWIQKWDGAEDSDIEPIKGGLSDSMKRASVQWGIGRVLYNMNDTVWVNIEKRGRSFIIKDSERPKLDKAYLDMLKRLGLTHADPIGTQAQLIPKGGPEYPGAQGQQLQEISPAPQTQQSKQPQAQKPSAQESFRHEETEKAPELRYEYTVTGLKVQNGMTGKSTCLELTARDGKKMQLFAKGTPAGLTYGSKLAEVKYSVRRQNTVVFNFLEDFKIVDGPAQQAA